MLESTSNAQMFPATEEQCMEQCMSVAAAIIAPLNFSREEGPGLLVGTVPGVSSFNGTDNQLRFWQLQP